jgi:hypothetical protein
MCVFSKDDRQKSLELSAEVTVLARLLGLWIFSRKALKMQA